MQLHQFQCFGAIHVGPGTGEFLALISPDPFTCSRTDVLPTRLNSPISVEPRSATGPRAAQTAARRLSVPRARVLKFGGSSVATPDRIRDVVRIVLNSMNGVPAVVVVSAFQGVTNDLLNCARLAERR